MKKTLLLIMWCMPVALVAQTQNGVKVSGLVVSVGSPTTVTFNVSWDKNDMQEVWVDSAWVFVDYNHNGVMERLLLGAGATLTETSAEGIGSVEYAPNDNDKGVWVVGNARDAGAFSATVQLLTATTDVAGACAYASNYPPVGKYNSATNISFTGTAPYTVVLEDSDGGTITQETVSNPYVFSSDYTIASFTDKTGAPGKFTCVSPTVYDLNVSASSFCAGVGVTFALSDTEDGRDYQLYRGATPVGIINGDGSAATFSGTFDVAGVYTAVSIADEAYCALSMNGAHTIAAYPAFTAGEITSAATTTKAGTDPNVTIASSSSASGGSGNISYVWVRTGTSSATLTGANATYTLGAADYGSAGTYYFNRYAKDATCSNAVYVAAAGTYTLTVEAAGGPQPQGNCTYTEPAMVGTFASFPSTYSASTYVALTDERDAKVYPVVKIGGRWIMARNLNYQEGLTWQANANSPSTVSGGSVTALIGHFWCPGGDAGSNATSSSSYSCEVWGALYSWETAMMVDGSYTSSAHTSSTWSEPALNSYGTYTNAANTQNHARSDAGEVTGGRGICPPNWHVPTDGEWGDLLNAMETSTKDHNSGTNVRGAVASSKSKSTCTLSSSTGTGVDDTHANWYYNTNETKGTDVYGFRVLPSGYRHPNDSNFDSRGYYAFFWSSSALDATSAWLRYFSYSGTRVYHGTNSRAYGFSVRCIRDVDPTIPPNDISVTLCQQCCYDGSAWVDCHVTTNAYPFDNNSTNTTVVWSGNGNTYYSGASGSGSDKNGRVNTASISSSTTTVNAVQICKDLGTGWYLPAYEELYAMSAGMANSNSNNLAGADILTDYWDWSSTEYYNNGGRKSSSSTTDQNRAMYVAFNGAEAYDNKTVLARVQCAWRPADPPPPNAASTNTWVLGGLLWSDAIQVTSCNELSLPNDYNTPACGTYGENGDTWYYYNAEYVRSYANQVLCPSPWRVPTVEDRARLLAVGVATDQALDAWGTPGTLQPGGANTSYGRECCMRAIGVDGSVSSAAFCAFDGPVTANTFNRAYGLTVRCVK